MKEAFRSAIQKTGYDLVRRHNRGPIYYRDGIHTDHNHDFIDEPRFKRAYERGLKGIGNEEQAHGPWRAHVATWAADLAMATDGDFIECGVFLGFMSSILMTYVDWNERANGRFYYLVDNFEGIVPALLTEQEKQEGRQHQYGDKYHGTYEAARANLAEFDNAIFIQGNVPDILPKIKSRQIAFLHLDMNAAIPETAAVRFFWPYLSQGAVILFDDYSYAGHREQRVAIDEVGKQLGFSVLCLPTGQGLAIKNYPPAPSSNKL